MSDDKELEEPQEPVSTLKVWREKAVEVFWLAFTVIMLVVVLLGAVISGASYLMNQARSVFHF